MPEILDFAANWVDLHNEKRKSFAQIKALTFLLKNFNYIKRYFSLFLPYVALDFDWKKTCYVMESIQNHQEIFFS